MNSWINKREHEALKQQLQKRESDLTYARNEIGELKVAWAAEKKICNAALKAAEAERTRGDGHRSSLIEVDRLILEEAETSRPFRPGFSQTILQIRPSEGGQGPKSPKLVSALLEEFKNDWNTSFFLDELHSDLVAWAKQCHGQAREQVFLEIGARIQNFRRGKSNDVQNLRVQIAGWKKGFENAQEETRKHQVLGDGLRSDMRKMKQDHDQTITKLIGEHELHNDRHVGEVARIKRDHGKDLARLNGNRASLDKRYEGDIKRLSIEHNSEIARLEEEHGEAETQARRYYDEEKARLEKTINGLRVELDRHKEESRNTATKLQASHASELQLQAKDHQIKEEEMKSELGETKRKHEQAMRSLEYEHGLLLQKEIGIHSSMIETMKQDHEKERSKWARDLAKEKENCTTERLQLTTEYNQQQSLMEQDYANETRLIREASDKKVAGLRDDLESQQAQFTRKVEEIKEGCKFQLGKLISKLDEIEAKHVAELRELRGSFEHEIEAYCEALLTRDKFTPIPDPEITSRFVALTQEVHALSLIEWKADRKKWSTQVLHQLSDNERSLKQQILKDIIWRALQEYIFCSPFRILGEEGKVLEKQWNDACGQGLLHALSWQLPLLEVR
jgi:hypothetical protein